jgi:prepilin-type N-terminal cleavage/methylation domain-containing protein
MYATPRSTWRGYTLLELIVVVAVIGLMATLLIGNAPAWTGDRAQSREAERLARMLAGWCTLAEAQGIEIGLLLAQTGYGFRWQGPAGWMPLSEAAYRDHGWTADWRLGVVLDREALTLPEQLPEAPQLICADRDDLPPLTFTLATPEGSRYTVRQDAGRWVSTRVER